MALAQSARPDRLHSSRSIKLQTLCELKKPGLEGPAFLLSTDWKFTG
jgi:hypothetical protein